MFFNDIKEIKEIASRSGCAVFVVPDCQKVEIKNAIVLEPTSKTVISIEDVKELILKLSVKQTSDQYILIRPADMLGLDAANALLKNLEEPGDKVHFVLVTSHVSQILPTILSRSFIFFLRSDVAPDGPIEKDEKIMEIAKKLVVAKPADLPVLAEEITKKKDSTRVYALDILATAIEILYKSYYKTGKDVFIKKVPKFLECYENIEKNGHTKLHLVADLC